MKSEKIVIIEELVKKTKIKLKQCNALIEIDKFDIFNESGIPINIRDIYNITDKKYREEKEEIDYTKKWITKSSHEFLDSTLFQIIGLLYNIMDCDKNYGNKILGDRLKRYYNLRLLLNHSRSKYFKKITVLSSKIKALGTEGNYDLEWHLDCILNNSTEQLEGELNIEILKEFFSDETNEIKIDGITRELINQASDIPGFKNIIKPNGTTLILSLNPSQYKRITFISDVYLLLAEIEADLCWVEEQIKQIEEV